MQTWNRSQKRLQRLRMAILGHCSASCHQWTRGLSKPRISRPQLNSWLILMAVRLLLRLRLSKVKWIASRLPSMRPRKPSAMGCFQPSQRLPMPSPRRLFQQSWTSSIKMGTKLLAFFKLASVMSLHSSKPFMMFSASSLATFESLLN